MNYSASMTRGAVAYAPVDVRMAFVRKVYGLFYASLLVTVGVGWLCTQPGVFQIAVSLMWPLLIAGFICIVALSFARRTSGLNVFLLYLFAAIEGAIFGPMLWLVNQSAPGLPAQTAALTVAVFGGLTLYAMMSRKDFSYLGGMLFIALIALVVAGFVLMFFHSSMLGTLYALGGVLLFSGYVLYDTSRIMLHLNPDEAVTGAVSLYLDFINLFLFILRLLDNRR
jgi:FtsH-binding integral membrane protein